MEKQRSLLILGYGNPSRGDDGVAPALIDQLEQEKAAGNLPDNFSTLIEFQLQIENTLDLQCHDLVLLVDASIALEPPFLLTRVEARKDDSYSSHALSPSALLSIYLESLQSPAPPIYLLAIKGYEFELGKPITPDTQSHLEGAFQLCRKLIRQQTLAYWDQQVEQTKSWQMPDLTQRYPP